MADSEPLAVTALKQHHAVVDFFSWVRSMKIGHKLVLIYILGIFLPLLVTNAILLRAMFLDASEQEAHYMRSKIENVMDNIEREFESLEDVTDFVYIDGSIYRALGSGFNDFTHFLTIYNDYLSSALTRYVHVFPGIIRMVIYTENPAIGVSGSFMSINNAITESEWFNNNMLRNTGMLTLYHVDVDTRMYYRQRRVLSLFRELDNPALERAGRLVLRIDINPHPVLRHIEASEYQGTIQLLDVFGNEVFKISKGELPADPFLFETRFVSSRALRGWVIKGSLEKGLTSSIWQARWTMLLIVSGLGMAFSALFILFLSRSITNRLSRLSQQMHKVKKEDFSPISDSSVIQDEIGQLITDYNLMASKIDALINRGYKLELEQGRLLLARSQAELNALESQVNPHFLYNVLESIRMKSHIKGEHETAVIIKKLSRIFRRMAGWDSDLVPLEEELAFTREYLDIQHYRFGDRLLARISFDPDALKYPIPKLSIQALVENACVHGLEQKVEGGAIDVRADVCNDGLCVSVSDDGVGCDGQALMEKILAEKYDPGHTGLSNMYRRLRMHFGEKAGMQITGREDSGLTVIICTGGTQ